MGVLDELYLFGAGGHANSVAEVARSLGFREIVCVTPLGDESSLAEEDFFEALISATSPLKVFVAVGSNAVRRSITEKLEANGCEIINLISQAACVGEGATIGRGSVVMPGAVIRAGVLMGKGSILNTGASIDHDCSVGNFSHIAPGATLCGGVKIGNEVLIGAGSTIIPNVTIASGSTIGAGSTVLTTVTRPGVYFGSPAKLFRPGGMT